VWIVIQLSIVPSGPSDLKRVSTDQGRPLYLRQYSDFELLPCCEYCIISFGGDSLGVWILSCRVFRNVGIENSDPEESPKRKNTTNHFHVCFIPCPVLLRWLRSARTDITDTTQHCSTDQLLCILADKQDGGIGLN